MGEILRLDNVSKTYNGESVPLTVLHGIDLSLKEGEFCSIMGPSGSGKSTLLHLLGCLDRPTGGDVFIRGKAVSRLSEEELARIRGKEIGFVFQFFYLDSNSTALENVMLPMIISGADLKRREERARKLLKIVGLEDRMDHLPSELSGGEKQRVAIARSMANEPSIILADEPTGNLDTKTGEEIIRLFGELNKQGKTVIFVTHDANIAKHTNKTIKIVDGNIVR